MSEKYFLGAMTQNGFSTEFGKIIKNKDFFTYILKGGAGTGKSSLMKKIAADFECDEDVVRFYCSSDPNSLDAVVLKQSKAAIVDGTSPHVFDPDYPGACQKIVNLGEHWDEEKLKSQKDKITEVTDKNHSLHARSKRYAAALSNVCFDTYFCGNNCLLNKKLDGFISRFTRKILGKKGSGTGSSSMRQLTALTEFGCITQTETLEDYLDVYYLYDDLYSCTNIVIKSISDEAQKRGYDVILCPSVVFNNSIFEHLLIPELGIALVSNSPMTKLSEGSGRKLNLMRFYDKDKLAKIKPRLKLNAVTAHDLADEVYDTIRNAKVVHDDIEKIYIDAMDFAEIDKVYESISADIRKNSKG